LYITITVVFLTAFSTCVSLLTAYLILSHKYHTQAKYYQFKICMTGNPGGNRVSLMSFDP